MSIIAINLRGHGIHNYNLLAHGLTFVCQTNYFTSFAMHIIVSKVINNALLV